MSNGELIYMAAARKHFLQVATGKHSDVAELVKIAASSKGLSKRGKNE